MSSTRGLPQRWVLPLAVLALLIPLVIIEAPILSYTKGTLVYPMDDAFIHLSVAKNLARHGVWGVSPYEFVSASSSILYPIVLAAIFLVTGANVITPLLVNLAAGILLLIVIHHWLRRQGLSPLAQLLVLLASVLLIPLPFIIRLGMEHTLQLLFCFLFIYRFCEGLSAGIRSGGKEWTLARDVFVYGALVTAIRYEGMFLIAVACLFLLYYRKITLSLTLGLVSFLPVIIFGIISIYHGNHFFPNPVLLKSVPIPSDLKGIYGFLTFGIFQKLYYYEPAISVVAVQRLLFLLPAVYLLFLQPLKQELACRLILVFLVAATFLHLVFANTNWLFRYEAYLLGAAIPVTGYLFAKYGGAIFLRRPPLITLTAAGAALILLFPYLLRTEEAFDSVEPACLNLYDQDYPVGQFLHKYYDSTRVGFNDLGCVTYFTSAKSLDLVGLGNVAVADSRRGHYYNNVFLDSIVKKEKIKIIVVFDRLFTPQLLEGWHKVASWHFDHVIVPGDETLSFFAVDSTMGPALKENLNAYRPFLPPGVTIRTD